MTELSQTFQKRAKELPSSWNSLSQKLQHLPTDIAHLPQNFESERDQFVKNKSNTEKTGRKGSGKWYYMFLHFYYPHKHTFFLIVATTLRACGCLGRIRRLWRHFEDKDIEVVLGKALLGEIWLQPYMFDLCYIRIGETFWSIHQRTPHTNLILECMGLWRPQRWRRTQTWPRCDSSLYPRCKCTMEGN